MEIKPCKVNVKEQETTICISRDSDIVTVYSNDNTFITKIKRVINKEDSQWEITKEEHDLSGNVCGYFFKTNKKAIRLGTGIKKTKKLNNSMEEGSDDDI